MPRNKRTAVQVYRAEVRRASLSTDAGIDLAARWFGVSREQAIERFGTYTRGPRKGLVRGAIVWAVVREGGWCYHLQTVLRPGYKVGGIMTNEEAARWTGLPTAELFAGLQSVPTRDATDAVARVFAEGAD